MPRSKRRKGARQQSKRKREWPGERIERRRYDPGARPAPRKPDQVRRVTVFDVARELSVRQMLQDVRDDRKRHDLD